MATGMAMVMATATIAGVNPEKQINYIKVPLIYVTEDAKL